MPHPAIINPPLPVKPNARYTREFPPKAEPPVKRKGKRRKKAKPKDLERAKRRRERLKDDPPMKTEFDLD
jgi:hypothetical protein